MHDVMTRARNLIRPDGPDDLWLNVSPSREQIEERIGSDEEVRGLLFEWSMVEIVVSNADPRATLHLLGDDAEPRWREQIQRIPMQGCAVKFNFLLRALPDFKARPGQCQPHHFAQINTPLTKTE